MSRSLAIPLALLAAACLRPSLHEPARAEATELQLRPHRELRLPAAMPWVPKPEVMALAPEPAREDRCAPTTETGEPDTGLEDSDHAPVILGAMDRSLVREAIEGEADRLEACWDRSDDATEEDLVILRLVIDPSGTVLHTEVESSTLPEPAVEACLAGRALSVLFPSSCHGLNIVSWPFEGPAERGEFAG